MHPQGHIASKATDSKWVTLELSVAGTTATATVDGVVAHASVGAGSGMAAVLSGWNLALFDNFQLEVSK